MKKLSKDDIKRRDAHVKKLTATKADIESAVSDLNTAIDEYNNELEVARGWIEDLVSSIDEYISEKSDDWQESDRGSAFATWKDDLEAIEFEGIDNVEIDDSNFSQIDTLNEMPEEPSL